MGNTPRLAARLSSTEDVSLVLQRLQRTVEELGRDDNSTTPNPPRGDLDRLTLCHSNVFTLPVTELRQGHRKHISTVQLVQLVQIALKRSAHQAVRHHKDPVIDHVPDRRTITVPHGEFVAAQQMRDTAG